jgi:hypothetical protein
LFQAERLQFEIFQFKVLTIFTDFIEFHLNLEHFKNSVQFVKQQEGFAAQLHLKFRCNTPELCTEEMAKIDGDKINVTEMVITKVINLYKVFLCYIVKIFTKIDKNPIHYCI